MKKLFLSFAALLVGAAAIAQPSDKFNGSLLWKISGNGLEAPSYILGTHHLNGQETFDAIAGAKAALESSAQVVGEMDMSNAMALATQLQQEALLPEGENYRNWLMPADYEALDNGLKELVGVGLDQFGMFKPGLISVTISQLVFMQAYPDFDATAHVAMDQLVQSHAKESGKAVVGLETIEDQIYALMDAEPYSVQAESLVCSIRNLDYSKESLLKMTDLYNAGDLAGLYALTEDPANPCPMSETSKVALLKQRNDRWMGKLPEIIKTPSFIAVGALHLAGEEGLLFQLDKMGYTVEAVK